MRLDLLVPGLAQALVLPDVQRIAPSAVRLLAHGRASPETAPNLEAWLAGQLHWDSVPVAALEAGTGYWLRADPVHLRLDQRGAKLLEAAELELSAHHAQALLAACAPVFAEYGGTLRSLRPACWTAQFADLPEPTTFSPLRLVRGCPVSEFLPGGSGSKRWRRLLNDLQIALHDHPVNHAREAAGLAPVNSLWLWGAGLLPAPPVLPWDGLWTDLGWLEALARRSKLCAHSAASGLILTKKSALIAVVLEALEAPLAYGDPLGLNAVMVEYERLWFTPLWQALRWGKVRQVIVRPLGGMRYDLHPWRCWWSGGLISE